MKRTEEACTYTLAGRTKRSLGADLSKAITEHERCEERAIWWTKMQSLGLSIRSVYCIAGNFRVVQIFVTDGNAKIKTVKF